LLELVELCNVLTNLAFIWWSLKKRCHDNQSRKIDVFADQSSLSRCCSEKYWNIGTSMGRWEAHLMWLHRVQIWLDSVKYNSGETFAHFCICVKKNCKNGHIRPIISERAWLILTKFSALIDMWVGWLIWRSFWNHFRDVAMVTN